jgi:D-alanine-D-alanine ligase-like ATP-grasp enzyme
LNSFREKYKEIIYKSSSSIRSVVKSIEQGDTGMDFHSIRNCATLFQERLVGTNYRVHVIGKKLFAIKAEAKTVDYRYSSREGKETILEETKLPATISKKCVALANSLGLVFAGIDLFLTEKNEWYCFEVNPSPGFSYFENNTGAPIAEAVVEYLVGG